MKRFTLRAFANYSCRNATTTKSLCFIPTQNPTSLLTTISYSFSQENMKSREIDLKITQQRWKSLQNSYKALKTSFGLQVPTTVSSNHPKPDKIFFNIESLRQCSNQYPEYLLEEMKLPESRFLEVIDVTLGKIWTAERKEAVEFILFLMHWKIYMKREEIAEMLVRAVNKIEINLFDIFELCKVALKEATNASTKETEQLLKTNPEMQKKLNLFQSMDPVMKKILLICQNRIIQRLDLIDAQQYEPLFKIINLFRLYDVYPEVKGQKVNSSSQPLASKEQKQQTFFEIIQNRLLKNMNEIPPSSLVLMAVHYANNTKQDQDNKIQILQKLEQRIIFTMKFFTHEELIAILYSYMKTSLLSQEFTKQFVQRIKLVYNEMSWQNKKKILSISSNFPHHQKILVISEAHHQLFKGKPIITKLQDGTIKKQYDPNVLIDLDYQLVPEIYLASYENNLLTEDLCKKMQQIILLNIYNYDHEEVVRAVWLFTVSPSVGDNLERLHKKLEVIIEGGFQGGEYTIKDVGIVVWSLCNSGVENQNVYRPEAKFWDNIEFYIEQKLAKQEKDSEPSRLSNISSILWAYTFNRPLKFKTVSLITDIILEDMTFPSKQHPEPNVQSFELINIITFYYSLSMKAVPKSLLTKIKQVCVGYFEAIYLEMSSLQLMKCLKYLAADQYDQGMTKLVIRIKIWQNIIDTFMSEANEIGYEHIMGIVGLVVNSPLGRGKDKRVMELVAKLLRRKKSLEQIKAMEEMGEKSRS